MARLALLAFGVCLACVSVASAQTPFKGIQAHRGGPNAGGQAAFAENTLEAFQNSRRLGVDVLELDVKLTQDGVPVVIHDALLDRTTDCDGRVRDLPSSELRFCPVDVVGIGDKAEQVQSPTYLVPTLADVLEFAKDRRQRVNVEIRNYPSDPDFDNTPTFAQAVVDVIEASGIRKRDVLVQSFLPPNLNVAKAAGFATSFLSLNAANSGAIATARANDYTVLSPEWPIDRAYMQQARAADMPVVTWTLNSEDDIRSAFRLGVAGVITDDPVLGIRTLYGPRCDRSKARVRRARARYRRASGDRKQAARRKLRKARRKSKRVCGRLERLN